MSDMHPTVRRFPVALAAALLLLGGCLTSRPIAPFPDSVVVPPPGQIDANQTYDDLREQFSTSPNRNPDGLGVVESLEARSRMTLWPYELEAKREEANAVAYQRTPQDQETVLARVRDFHAAHVVFEGVLLSTVKEFADARWYLPEGIYLVDDRGRKFKPLAVDEDRVKTEYLVYLPPVSQYSTTADIPRWSTGFPRLVFPGEAIGPQTKAIVLYVAAAGRRISFTWIFDSAYVPSRQNLGPAQGAGMHRLFGTQ
jgi:hypothetical protein